MSPRKRRTWWERTPLRERVIISIIGATVILGVVWRVTDRSYAIVGEVDPGSKRVHWRLAPAGVPEASATPLPAALAAPR